MQRRIAMLFSVSFQPFQGRYMRVLNEAKTLVDKGYDVTVFAWDRECTSPEYEVRDGVRIERIAVKSLTGEGPKIIFKLLRYWWRLFRRLAGRQFDVIHCHNLDVQLPGFILAKLKRAKKILDVCEPEYYVYWPKRYFLLLGLIRWFEGELAKRSDYVLVHNDYQIQKYREYGVGNVELIGSYPTPEMIAGKVVPKQNEEKDSSPVVIGRIGTIYQDCGIEEIVLAFEKLLRTCPEARLLLAGRVFDGYAETFESLIKPIRDSVEVIGAFPSSQLPEIYRKIDISIMTYRRSDWFVNITPTKFFDSMARGVPIITSDIGGLKEITEEYDCALIVDETDINEIYQTMEELAQNPHRRYQMAKEGLRGAKEKYNWGLMAKRLLRVYESLFCQEKLSLREGG